MSDDITIDTLELRMNWAVDGVADGINELMSHLEGTRDVEGLEALSKLVRAMSNYISAVREPLA